MQRIQLMLVASLFGSSLAACATDDATTDDTAQVSSDVRQSPQARLGEFLFDHETFRGNGRTCSTCHTGDAEALAPADVQARAHHGYHDPLFQGIDADTNGGNTYNRLLTDATIRIEIPLPANVAIQGSTARTAELFRGVPSTLNAPALQPVLMADGRAPDVVSQAHSAVDSHFQPGREPSNVELQAIAAYEDTQFSRGRLADFAAGGPPPELPQGRTDSEKRGRIFFTDDAHALVPRCVHCHSGPMLDTTSPGLESIFGVPAGSKIFTAFVSQVGTGGGTPVTYLFTDATGTVTPYTSTDPGRALISGNAADADMFKITTLWNAKNTAPYFHNNGAKNLDELMDHYEKMFALFGLSLSTQDRADIIAYLKLL